MFEFCVFGFVFLDRGMRFQCQRFHVISGVNACGIFTTFFFFHMLCLDAWALPRFALVD